MDLGMVKNREILIMKFQKEIMQSELNIHSKKIKILELEEEIEKCHSDMIDSQKVIEKAKSEIEMQTAEMAKEKS